MAIGVLERAESALDGALGTIENARLAVAECAEDAWTEFTSNDIVSSSLETIQEAADGAWETCCPALEQAGNVAREGARNGVYLGGRAALGVADVGEDAYIGIRSNMELIAGDHEAAVETAQIHLVDSAADAWGDFMQVDDQIREAGDYTEAAGEIATEIALGTVAITASAPLATATGVVLTTSGMGKSLEANAADGEISQDDVIEEVAIGTVNAAAIIAGRGINRLAQTKSTGRAAEASESTASSRYIECPNSSLAGDLHPITGVPFEKKTVALSSGERVEGVFPIFESQFDARISGDLLTSSNRVQFKECNSQLLRSIESDPEVARKFSSQQIEQIREGVLDGSAPDGFVWHHNEEEGLIQLVDRAIHEATGHTAGKAIWGGGY